MKKLRLTLVGLLALTSAASAVATRSDAALFAYGALRRLRRSGLILGALIFGGCSTAPRIPYTVADQTAAVNPEHGRRPRFR